MITADPNTLRYGANRFAAAAQEMKRQAIHLEQTTRNDGWSGEGAQAFLMRGERLVNDANKACQAFESVANTLSRFAMRMEHVLELRRRADRIDQQAFEYGDETLDSIHTRQHLRHQAAQLRYQADSEASIADAQASKEFQMIAQMIPATLVPGADENANILEGLPKHWQDYYRRHPELLEEETLSTPTMSSTKSADYQEIQRRNDAKAALIEYHKQQQSPWLSEKDKQEAARIYFDQAYSMLSTEELEKEIARTLEEERENQYWQNQIQSGVYGKDLILRQGYLAYAMREYYKGEGPLGGMHGVLVNMGKLKNSPNNQQVDKIENQDFKRNTTIDSKSNSTNQAGGMRIPSEFADRAKLEGHFKKHGNEFRGTYKNADEYLQGARDVIQNGEKVQYKYKLKDGTIETRMGFVRFMNTSRKGEAKFEFVGTNNQGQITTYHVESGKDFWKMLNGSNVKIINPIP